MATWVVDRSLDVLLGQVDEAAPGRDKSSDGSIGDEAHQGTGSKHNPEDTEDSSDGNDPDNQVDARDFTHDPDSGADMHQMTEEIRVSRDRRVNLVIWNRRQFSSYSTSSRKAWTWGTYSGSNPHDKHAHVETNDKYNDDLTPWKVFMSLTSKQDAALHSTEWRLWYNSQLQESYTNPATGKVETSPLVTLLKRMDAQVKSSGTEISALKADIAELKGMLKVQGEQILALLNRPPVVAGPVDPDTLQPVVEDGVRAVLRNGVDHA